MYSVQKQPDVVIKESHIDSCLSIGEEIAVFCNERTITKNHAKEFFWPDLKAISANKSVYEYLKKKYDGTTYHNLWKMMQEYKLIK